MQTFERSGRGTRANANGSSLRVMRIVTRLNVGGPARQILGLEPALARRGVDEILLAGVCDQSEADLAELLGYAPVRRIGSLGRAPSPRADAGAFATLAGAIGRFRPHVVHTHMAKAGALGRAAALVRRVPVRIHTYHGHTLHGYFSAGGRSRMVFAERRLASVSSALVAVSHRVAEDLLDAGIGRPDQFRVLSPGLDLTPFAAREPGGALRHRLGIGPGDPVIGFVARLVPVKRLDVLLESAAAVLERVPTAHLVIAGDGPDMALVRDALTRRPELADRIHPVGWVDDMARFYADVDLVVLTSENEGTPISLIEAGAAGLPVVASRVGGVPEVVDDGRTGLLVPAGDPAALAGAVVRLIESPGLRARLGSEARRRSDRYSSERLADETLALYRELLDRRRATPA
jgi:glycosyltransferase involved in cell wall biosynthesis